MTSILQKIKNIWKLGEISITPEKKEQIANIIALEKPKRAQIIHMKSDEEIIKELLEEK